MRLIVLLRSGAFARARRPGFTLIELLLVAAIIGVMAAVTVPMFVRSIHGNRLRAATRTTVMAGRYARSMSLMTQREWSVRFDLDESRIVVGPAQRAYVSPRMDADMGTATMNQPPPSGLESGGDNPEAAAPAAPSAGMNDELVRELDNVRIVAVDVDEDGRSASGTGRATIVFRTNGRCTPYVVELRDEDGETSTVEVDALGVTESRK